MITPEDIKDETGKFLQDMKDISPKLSMVLETSERLKELKSTIIKFSDPVLKQGENAVIFPHTINVIQGQAGVHKSRLAECICSAFLKLNGCNSELLGFKRTNFDTAHTVVYVDTERNLSEQLPYALQSIQMKAGYKLEDHPTNFMYFSLLQISRNERFDILNECLNLIRQTINNPLFVVLDVTTDCIEDFNKADKSLELIDLMNKAINQYNVIFLCLIHENPKSDKARGHIGTELMNKASTVMQVGFEKDANQNDTNIIRVKYLKCRSTAKHAPFYFKYCPDNKGLVLAELSEVSAVINSRKQKANQDDLIEFIELHIGNGEEISRPEFIKLLNAEFGTKDRIIESRIKKIISDEATFVNQEGVECILSKFIKGKNVFYKLTPFKKS
jgi:hypothetical protein